MSKKSMNVRDVAVLANVKPEVVRYYSRIKLIKPDKSRKNGYKLYDDNDISKLIFIRKSKKLGYTLNEIRNILSHSNAGTSPCPMVRKIIENRIDDNRKRLNELLELQQRMEVAVEQWARMPDGIPDGDSVCVLIESFTHELSQGQENGSGNSKYNN